jgi:maleylacetoacetate isomerase
MVDKVVLYSYFRSSASWRVRIALAIKGINYEYRAVNLIKDEGEQYSEEYVKLNPMSQVPSLLIDGHCLIQSLPIIEYLDEKYHEPPLLPKDSFGRSQVRAIAEIMNSGIQPLHNLKILQQVGEEKVAWARTHIEHGLKAIERALATTAGTFSYGDQVTLADICLVPQVYAAKRFKIDMSQYPIISRVNDVLVEIPAFKAADAFRQPDTPEDLRVV